MFIFILILTGLYSFNIQTLKPKIQFKLDIQLAKTNKDIFARALDKNKFFIPAYSNVKLLSPKISKWYKIFKTQNSEPIYINEKSTNIEHNKLYIKAPIPFYKKPLNSLPSSGSFKGGELFTYFSELNIPLYKILFQNKSLWIEAKYLTIDTLFKPKFYEKIPIAIVSKLKGKSFTSKNIDKLVYMTTKFGVLVSKNTKSWYRIKKLENRKYKIALTNEGCLLADNLYSCDFGKSFAEFFPSYAIPKNSSKINELIFSPNGLGFTLISFKDTQKYTYIYDPKQLIWRRLYPAPQFEFRPLSKENILKAFVKSLSKKYNIMRSSSALDNKIIYLNLLAKNKDNGKIFKIIKTLKFNKHWQENKEQFIFLGNS